MTLLSEIVQIALDSNRTWTESLNKASFRGVPFAIYGGDARFGRRLALHDACIGGAKPTAGAGLMWAEQV